MRFEIYINSDNAAFADDPGPELARILRKEADKLEDWCECSETLYDINGNAVGTTLLCEE